MASKVLKTYFLFKDYAAYIILAFFASAGFYESTKIFGAFTAAILYLIVSVSVMVSLIPFVGFFVWRESFHFFSASFAGMQLTDTFQSIATLVAVLSIIICVVTSILTVIMLYFILKFYFKKTSSNDASTIDTLIHTLPTSVISKMLSLDDESLKDVLTVISAEVTSWIKKTNHKLLGSAGLFFSLGVASHDFKWEASLYESAEVDVRRLSHGAYTGLLGAVGSLHIVNVDLPFKKQLEKNALGYLGAAISALGFLLLGFIPLSLGRVVNHLFWWFGVFLIVYCWLQNVKEKLLPSQQQTLLTEDRSQP